MSDRCKSCGAPVVWSLTPAGARAPIDAEPDVEKGNVLLLAPSGFAGLLSVVLSKGSLVAARGGGVALRLNHWATCPDKAEWREKTDAAKAAT